MVTGACGFLGMRLVKLLLEEEKLEEIRLMDKHVQPDLLHNLEGKIKKNSELFRLTSLTFHSEPVNEGRGAAVMGSCLTVSLQR